MFYLCPAVLLYSLWQMISFTQGRNQEFVKGGQQGIWGTKIPSGSRGRDGAKRAEAGDKCTRRRSEEGTHVPLWLRPWFQNTIRFVFCDDQSSVLV